MEMEEWNRKVNADRFAVETKKRNVIEAFLGHQLKHVAVHGIVSNCSVIVTNWQ